jgi:hypothetical protein
VDRQVSAKIDDDTQRLLTLTCEAGPHKFMLFPDNTSELIRAALMLYLSEIAVLFKQYQVEEGDEAKHLRLLAAVKQASAIAEFRRRVYDSTLLSLNVMMDTTCKFFDHGQFQTAYKGLRDYLVPMQQIVELAPELGWELADKMRAHSRFIHVVDRLCAELNVTIVLPSR